jgi:Flp pilus assembly protein TadG
MKFRYGVPARQKGITLVEFAIIGALAMMLIFAVLEIARAFFVANALAEATRRGARMAAVCWIDDPAIAQVATFNAPGAGNTSPIVNNLDTSDFVLEYLNRAGTVLGSPAAADFMKIRYVQVRVVNFEHELLIPYANITITMPEFSTRLPRESLGVPRSGTEPITC